MNCETSHLEKVRNCSNSGIHLFKVYNRVHTLRREKNSRTLQTISTTIFVNFHTNLVVFAELAEIVKVHGRALLLGVIWTDNTLENSLAFVTLAVIVNRCESMAFHPSSHNGQGVLNGVLTVTALTCFYTSSHSNCHSNKAH